MLQTGKRVKKIHFYIKPGISKRRKVRIGISNKKIIQIITANIAEGYGRFTYTDTRHFFIIARGSVTETMEHLVTAYDEKYISEEKLKTGEEKCEIVFKLLNGFIAYLDRSDKSAKTTTPIPNS